MEAMGTGVREDLGSLVADEVAARIVKIGRTADSDVIKRQTTEREEQKAMSIGNARGGRRKVKIKRQGPTGDVCPEMYHAEKVEANLSSPGSGQKRYKTGQTMVEKRRRSRMNGAETGGRREVQNGLSPRSLNRIRNG